MNYIFYQKYYLLFSQTTSLHNFIYYLLEQIKKFTYLN